MASRSDDSGTLRGVEEDENLGGSRIVTEAPEETPFNHAKIDMVQDVDTATEYKMVQVEETGQYEATTVINYDLLLPNDTGNFESLNIKVPKKMTFIWQH